ncbi:hypothetical protein K6U06_11260 [Acidiferrimicrobium sp. IK]|uniref:hypothetical protein n=1 Tax=Acidiferrimicrobium sp. IK TaxID=2871700 RepID=UPI0021CB8305|nr:hypothetical protein [Acidiferrimicrobium sp. IK]MCU4184940.1 hypothetical protein [Acidiferrimicrobium sp. IK]
MDPDEGGGDGDVERYEALRAQALGGDAAGWRHGVALLQGRGMAAWLRTSRSIPPVGSRPAGRPTGTECLGGDLVGVLASMALAVVG